MQIENTMNSVQSVRESKEATNFCMEEKENPQIAADDAFEMMAFKNLQNCTFNINIQNDHFSFVLSIYP